MATAPAGKTSKKKRPALDAETRTEVEHDLALGQFIYDLRTEAGH